MEDVTIDNLIDCQVAELRKNVTSDEALNIGEAIYSHLKHFFDKLGRTYPSSRVSELIKVGSFHEGTKIYVADEFDFIAVLEELSNPDIYVIEGNCADDGKVNIRFTGGFSEYVAVDAEWDKDDLQERQAKSLMERVFTRLYNTVMIDRTPARGIALYDHNDLAEWMVLPCLNGIELSVRFCEAKSPNMIWEFLYKDHIISVDVSLAIRCGNVDELYKIENATVLEVGQAIVQRGALLLMAYRDGFRITVTETEVEFIKGRLNTLHKHMYMYLKYFNYKYGENTLLKAAGYLPFSSYMLKTICIYHDQRCKTDRESTSRNKTCLYDIIDIMEESLSKGYQCQAEIVNGTSVGYLPNIFDKTKNLYKEVLKPVDRLKALREAMVTDIKTIHFSGRKWKNLSHLVSATHEEVLASAKKVCDKSWSDSKYLLLLKLK